MLSVEERLQAQQAERARRISATRSSLLATDAASMLAELSVHEADLEATGRRLQAQQHWTRARRLMSSMVDARLERESQAQLQQQTRTRIDLLQRLTTERATDLESLVAELSTVRDRLENVRTDEGRFVPRMHCEELRARHRALQIEVSNLARYTETAQMLAGRLRVVIGMLSNLHGQEMVDLNPTEDLRVRATRALEAMAQFERLFEAGRHAEAAVIAARSPEHVLRTSATWERFCAAARVADNTSHRSPRRIMRASQEMVRRQILGVV